MTTWENVGSSRAGATSTREDTATTGTKSPSRNPIYLV